MCLLQGNNYKSASSAINWTGLRLLLVNSFIAYLTACSSSLDCKAFHRTHELHSGTITIINLYGSREVHFFSAHVTRIVADCRRMIADCRQHCPFSERLRKWLLR